MYLKRITIVGFKSFAAKTVLNLERGITAVVGPNGSGKSNIADAVRWALGEQSKSRLRLGDREEVVFAGSDKRPRASFAEVVLLFDNEAGIFPLDLTEVEISRRLYRSGETDYQLAGRPVKLGDLQQLLATAGFGVGSYAVIGQGTIDSLLLSSPSERKLLFDEAAGIRGVELSRESAGRKLAATEANLVRLRDIAAELAPRAAALERAAAAADEQTRLEHRVTDLRSTVIATAVSSLTTELKLIQAVQASHQRAYHRLRHVLTTLRHQQAQQMSAAAKAEAEVAAKRHAISHLETSRDMAAKTLGAAEARVTATISSLTLNELSSRKSMLEQKLSELTAEQAETTDELKSNRGLDKRAAGAIEAAGLGVAAAQAELLAVRQQLSDGTRQQYVGHALELVKVMARSLDAPNASVSDLRLLIHKTGRLLSHASRTGEADLVTALRSAQTKLEAAMAKRETATEHYTNITLSARSLELDITRQQQEAAHLNEELTRVGRQIIDAIAARQQLSVHRAAASEASINLSRLTAELEAAREATTADIAPVEAVAALAVQIERTRSQMAELTNSAAQDAAHRHQLRERLTEYAQRAMSWQVATVPPSDRPLAELESSLERLEGELAARIQLGLDQHREYTEVSSRQSELVTQMADLEAAKSDLETMVTKLAVVIRERFRTNFEHLSSEFSRQASRLFEGGEAGLSLVEDETGEYGIQIKVSPKGKRLASLAALSGGERAMAGVALLAAILVVNPSPFVVLDEIDAALDDANSGRLAEIMSELAARSQLIVITHNRQTMKAADVLFGVTMNDQHVSHLLSLHLEQATQLAAR